jgi:hypothetical protein
MVFQAVLALEQADERLHPIADGVREGALGRVLVGGVPTRGRGADPDAGVVQRVVPGGRGVAAKVAVADQYQPWFEQSGGGRALVAPRRSCGIQSKA